MVSLAELDRIKNTTLDKMGLKNRNSGIRVTVGMATCGIAAGARPIMDAFVEEIKKRNLDNVSVTMTGCIGVCRLEPIVEVVEPDGKRTVYVEMTPEKAAKVVEEHLAGGRVCSDYTMKAAGDKHGHGKDYMQFFNKQMRIALKNCGIINPESIDEYIAMDG